MWYAIPLTVALVAALFDAQSGASPGNVHSGRQLPPGLTGLDLNDEQKDLVLDIVERYDKQVSKLQQQLRLIRIQEQAEISRVLTEQQREVFNKAVFQGPEPAGVYNVRIKKLEMVNDWRQPKDKDEPRDAMDAMIYVDKDIPRGPGTMIVEVMPNRKVALDIIPELGKEFPLGKPTKRFKVSWMPTRDKLEPETLVEKPARIFIVPKAVPKPQPSSKARDDIHDYFVNIQLSAFQGNKMWKQCLEYSLEMDWVKKGKFKFVLNVLEKESDRDTPYFLSIVNNANHPKAGLARQIQAVLSKNWPKTSFEFQADANNEITAVQ